MKTGIIIALASILLATTAASVSIVKSAWGTIDQQKVQIEDLSQTITGLRSEYEKNMLSLHRLQAKDQANQTEINKVKAQAIKDVSRVENVAIKKSKLYENLVNRDFRETQNEFSEISK